jgi:BlaI family transcriptional regulator, penicillinase repressor
METNSNLDPVGASRGPRHSILDLAPLELECMTVLWPLGAGTVREIHHRLALSRPRAYTTVLTIMDRLAQKGIVTRRKVGRAYRYEPRLSVEEARLNAVGKIVEGFFEGSPQALAAHLSSQTGTSETLSANGSAPAAPILSQQSTGTGRSDEQALAQSKSPRVYQRQAGTPNKVDAPSTPATESQPQSLDDTLL